MWVRGCTFESEGRRGQIIMLKNNYVAKKKG